MISENIKAVQARVAEALAKRTEAKITGDKVTLVAVTKNHAASVIQETTACGIANIGENKVQEAMSKQEIVGAKNIWHLLGHLQTNKVKQAVEVFDLVESVDSEKLLEALNKAAVKSDKVQEVLLQVNLTKEPQKSGFTPEAYQAILPLLIKYENIRVRGIMVIAKQTEVAEETRSVFQEGYQLFCSLREYLGEQVTILSMGMTHDYWVAIEEGSNQVRIGTAIFGARDYSK